MTEQQMAVDFDTSALLYRGYERKWAGYWSWRAVFGSPDEDRSNPWAALAREMAKVCTPYWPCTDVGLT